MLRFHKGSKKFVIWVLFACKFIWVR